MQGLNLSACGAAELTFAGLSMTAVCKSLLRIAEAESVPLSPEQAKALASAANGDLLNAIETLQLYSSGKVDLSLLRQKKTKKVISAWLLWKLHCSVVIL